MLVKPIVAGCEPKNPATIEANTLHVVLTSNRNVDCYPVRGPLFTNRLIDCRLYVSSTHC